MSDIVIRFDLRLDGRWRRVALAGALMLAGVPQLGSESLTLSTYYPAPSGVYTNMITTRDTYLARDSGNVGIGTASPGSKLHVNGTSTLGGNTTVSGNLTISPPASGLALDVAQNSHFRLGQAYLSSGGGYMHLANNAYYNGGGWTATGLNGALLQFSGQTVSFYSHTNGNSFTQTMSISAGGDLTVPSRMTVTTASIDITGHIVARGQSACSTAHVTPYPTTGSTSCPGGTYATLQSGIISKYVIMPRYADVLGNSAVAWMLCCPCPSTGCPSL